MKRLGVYLKPYTLESILGPLFKLLEALLELLVPLVVADIIDTGIGAGDSGFIVKRCLLLIGLGLLGLASSVTAQYFAAKAAIGFTASVRHALFGKVQSLSYAELDKLGTSTLMTRMTSDMNQVQTGLNLALRLLLRSPFVVFGAMIMAFTIDVKSAWVFAVIIPLLFAVVFGIMFSCIPLYKKVQGRLDGVLGAAKENLAGVRVIRAFGKERQEVESFEEKSGQLLSSQLFVGKISALLNPVTYVMINLAIIAVLRVGGGQVYKGILTQGQVLALYNYMSQILVELIKMANLILSMTKATASAKRVAAILALESSLDVPQENPEEPEAAPAVSFDGVTFTYPTGGAPALSDFLYARARQNARHHRRHGLWKIDAHRPYPALLRCAEGQREGRRLRRVAVSAGDAPKKNRPCAAEGAAFQGHHPGESSLGRRGRGGRCDLRCAPGRAGAGGRGWKAGGLRLRGRDRRAELFRRPAAKAYDCARAGEKAGSPDSGRQRVGSGFRDGRGASARAQRASVEAGSCHYLAENSIYSLCGRDSRTG